MEEKRLFQPGQLAQAAPEALHYHHAAHQCKWLLTRWSRFGDDYRGHHGPI